MQSQRIPLPDLGGKKTRHDSFTTEVDSGLRHSERALLGLFEGEYVMLQKSILGLMVVMTLWATVAHAGEEKRPKRWQFEADAGTVAMGNINSILWDQVTHGWNIGLTEVDRFGSIDLGFRTSVLFANSSAVSSAALLGGLVIGPASTGPLHSHVTVGITQPLYVRVLGVDLPADLDLYGELRLAYDVADHFGVFGGARYSRAGDIADWSGVFIGLQIFTGNSGGNESSDEGEDEDEDDIGARARRALEDGK